MLQQYDNIPELLRWERRWCLAGPDDHGAYKAPHAVGMRGIFRIPPTQEIHLKDFETTLDNAQAMPPCGIGFVLFKKDGYTCIDLDIKNKNNYPDNPELWTSQENIDRFHRIIKAFDSYTEYSASGQGFHIWIKGSIGAGLKRDGVEIYSQERFIVCTGNVFLNKDIEKRQELLDILASEIKQATPIANGFVLEETEPTETDMVIFGRAREAENSDKFIKLCEGDFSDYPSQSEADLALLSIFAFYSKSNSQCRRLFRLTKLGEREKATKNNVAIDRSLRVIRQRQENEAKIALYAEASANALLAAMSTGSGPANSPPSAANSAALPITTLAPNSAPSALLTGPILFPEHAAAIEAGLEPEPFDAINDLQPEVEFPPGFVGTLAAYIYRSAPRPVKEVAIVAALGLIAGVCGKAFHIPQSGLNLYIVLVAKSAVGKEAMHSGISTLISTISSNCPEASTFVDFADYASGPALRKAVTGNTSFVNVSGEWGRKLRRLGMEDGRDGPMQQLRTVMTDLYQKSGPKAIVGGIGYSDKEKNVASVSGVAYSMIGETTPDTFYDALTETMMSDGFMSRFTVVEYRGDRPDTNKEMMLAPDTYMLDQLILLMNRASQLNGKGASQLVEPNEEARAILDAFDAECDKQVRATDDEGQRQMWNRAHLKVYRIAANLAAANGHSEPIINATEVKWALGLIRKDISIMQQRIKAGDVGVGDASRERKLLDIIGKYLQKEVASGYKVPDAMRKDGIVPRKYLQTATQRVTSFTSHRLGQGGVLDMTIKSLVDSGYIMEMPKDKITTKYNFFGRCFLVVALPEDFMGQKSQQ